MKPIVFTINQAQAASDNWEFNCGPAAICAVLGMTPDGVRPYLGDFEQKHYTNPKLMKSILHKLSVQYTWKVHPNLSSLDVIPPQEWPQFGLVRIQWDGPWCAPARPWQERGRQTHWVAYDARDDKVFDINATCVGGWISRNEWETKLVPWLLRQCVPRANGRWWITHTVEIPLG